ncbi:uncharacterized protein LOC142741080 isoform X3 [Rhinoderma darwinii]|uniref:uncharacterized protein LOC142741080 isoform X3 n=1 Tax=Rhinoderma darwinii TaxID=43563 RepID=UPI003F6644FD
MSTMKASAVRTSFTIKLPSLFSKKYILRPAEDYPATHELPARAEDVEPAREKGSDDMSTTMASAVRTRFTIKLPSLFSKKYILRPAEDYQPATHELPARAEDVEPAREKGSDDMSTTMASAVRTRFTIKLPSLFSKKYILRPAEDYLSKDLQVEEFTMEKMRDIELKMTEYYMRDIGLKITEYYDKDAEDPEDGPIYMKLDDGIKIPEDEPAEPSEEEETQSCAWFCIPAFLIVRRARARIASFFRV